LQMLEHEVLPEFVKPRRWFAGKGSSISATRLLERTPWRTDRGEWLFALMLATFADESAQRYFMPLGVLWEDSLDPNSLRTAEWTLAKVRQHARAGVMVDAFADAAFCLSVAEAVSRGEVLPLEDGEIRFESTSAMPELLQRGIEPVQHLGREQSNTAVILGDALFLKGYRQARSGINPDAEVAGYLTEAGYRHIPRLGGTVTLHRGGEQTLLIGLYAFVGNQGDAWQYTLNHLERYATELLADASHRTEQPHMLFLGQMRTLAQRIGELHATLAQPTQNAAFAPEPIEGEDLRAWGQRIEADVGETLQLVEAHLKEWPEDVQNEARTLLEQRRALVERIRMLVAKPVRAIKTRFHGDLHLGQILLCADDFLITDFEGEPARPIEERRRKNSALIDVAGMLRSFDYARAVGLDRALATRPETREVLEPAFDSWYHLSAAAFFEGYRRGLGETDVWPDHDADAQRLVSLFQIEKALYEIRYEANNRPTWISVPIRGVMRLVR
jgi:maltose alpha-D-glucosyltransferase/alpha-amylase